MDLKQFECFVAVAEELSFRRAAERLSMSQSAVSDRIAALEYTMGITLLFRTTRQVSLTQAGVEFLKDISAVLNEIDRSVENARQVSASGLNRIRVSGVDEAISIQLPLIMTEFRRQWPDIAVQILEISSSDRHLQELNNRQADVAFIRESINDDYIISELLYKQPVVVVVNAQSPLAKAKSLQPTDIAQENIIGYPKHARPILHDAIWRSFKSANLQPKITSEVIDKSTLMHFVKQGLGIGLAPKWVENISPGGLAFIPYIAEQVDIGLYIAYRKNGNSQTIDEFIEVAKQVGVAAAESGVHAGLADAD